MKQQSSSAHRPSRRRKLTAVAAGLTLTVSIVVGVAASTSTSSPRHASGYQKRVRAHFDHTAVLADDLGSPRAITRKCLDCHPEAVSIMKTAHWNWAGDEVQVPGHEGKVRIGKKNLLNNFCLTAQGNQVSCAKCHIGYGMVDNDFDFSQADSIDCLVCHEHTNTYVKASGGLPAKGTDLMAAARSVGTPQRENCLTCHAYGGGGQAVKHGDLDSSLVHPPADEDVHIGRHGFLCVDCHTAPDHQLRGRAFSVSVEDANGVACEDCHTTPEHLDERLNKHLAAVACQTCHVPTFARLIPTKATWDWSKAGDKDRVEDPHSYLRIKGEFTYEQDVVPEYRWFNMTVDRYLKGDEFDPSKPLALNPPRGDIRDPKARIWPFKVHRGVQPYDTQNAYLLAPVTAGKDGYWSKFDWDLAFRLGEKTSGLAFSGKYGWAKTEMVWPLTHMVAPKDKAMGCTECHGERSRLDWKALGYPGDPIKSGGRS